MLPISDSRLFWLSLIVSRNREQAATCKEGYDSFTNLFASFRSFSTTSGRCLLIHFRASPRSLE